MARSTFLLPLCLFFLWPLVASRPSPAPYLRDEMQRIKPDEYFISLYDNCTLEAHLEHVGFTLSAADIDFRYYDFIHTYRIRIDAHTIHNIIRHDPGVEYVEHSYLTEPLYEPALGEPDMQPESYWSALRRRWRKMVVFRNYNVRMVVTWGKLPTPVVGANVEFLDFAGQGVNVYVMDTGIRTSHIYFQKGGPAIDFKGTSTTPYCDENELMTDTDGHGTRVAGVIKKSAFYATIVNVKAICANDELGDFVSAFRDIFTEHKNFQQGVGTPNEWRGSVINISADLGRGTTLGLVVDVLSAAGIAIATSAGNFGREFGTGPCSYPTVQCVAACDENYKKPDYSNYGSDITIVVPGDKIESASYLDDDSVAVRSGSSYASPHVAGLMATYIGYEGIPNDLNKVLQRVHDNAQPGLLGSNFAPNTVDLLANTGLQNPGKDDDIPYVGAPPVGFPEDPNAQTGPIITATTTESPVTTEVPPVDPFEGLEPGAGSGPFVSDSATITVTVPAQPSG